MMFGRKNSWDEEDVVEWGNYYARKFLKKLYHDGARRSDAVQITAYMLAKLIEDLPEEAKSAVLDATLHAIKKSLKIDEEDTVPDVTDFFASRGK